MTTLPLSLVGPSCRPLLPRRGALRRLVAAAIAVALVALLAGGLALRSVPPAGDMPAAGAPVDADAWVLWATPDGRPARS